MISDNVRSPRIWKDCDAPDTEKFGKLIYILPNTYAQMSGDNDVTFRVYRVVPPWKWQILVE